MQELLTSARVRQQQPICRRIAAFTLIGAVIWTILDLPVLIFVRMAFIGSFFIKTEISLFKIDEIEDPSGFNISLAVVCAAILLAHDWLTADGEENQPRFPAVFAVLTAGLMYLRRLIGILQRRGATRIVIRSGH